MKKVELEIHTEILLIDFDNGSLNVEINLN